MYDEEDIYLYSWLDPKNEGKTYTEEAVRQEIGHNLAADTIVASLKEEGVIVPTPSTYVNDEEEIHIYPWLDPKNDGKLYTEEEARKILGNNGYSESIIRQLKEEGVIGSTYEVNTQRESLSINNVSNRINELEEDLHFKPSTSYAISRYSTLNSYYEENSTDPIDMRLDEYYEDMVNNQYDKKGIDLLSTMASNIEALESLTDDGLIELKGCWAEINKELIDYNIENVKEIQKYMISSMAPALEAVKELTEILISRNEKKIELGQKEEAAVIYKKAQPNEENLIKTDDEYWRDKYGDNHSTNGYYRLHNPEHDKWLEKYNAILHEIYVLKKDLEELTQKADELLSKIEEYSEQTIEFKEFISHL